ncbi:oligosaccharide flippase family protein [Neiella marina]|uniref:Oligosaccharide flippase family protein n=1 Tax=Neiella holothuriorum TaxID=2870530 RepID=A0ABS7EDX5_9GAMM|nr:oligosaccharide flippase family protein [Neiella holothuriorum]MBW8190551.1 oligosaccharide flippase family protein [Neiella holothuriorum]
MNLTKGISITLVSNLVFALSQWVIVAGLNHLGSVDVVGRYAYSITLAGFFLTVGQMGLRQYLLSSTVTSELLAQAFGARLISSLIAFVCLAAYALLVVDDIYLYLVLVLGIAKWVENMTDIAHGFYQRNFKITHIAWSRTSRSLLTPVLFLSVFYYSSNIYYACAALIGAWLLLFVLFDKASFIFQPQRQVNFRLVSQLLKKAFPLGVTSVLVLLAVSLPLFILAEVSSETAVGQYASVFYFVTAASLILQSVLQVLSPIIVRHLSDNEFLRVRRLIKQSYWLALSYGICGVIIAVAIGEWVLNFVYGPQYIGLGYLAVLAAVLNGALALQAVGGIMLTAHGVFNFQMFAMIISVIVSAISGYFAIQVFGIAGAFYAGIVTALVNAVLFGIRVLKETHTYEKLQSLAYHQST